MEDKFYDIKEAIEESGKVLKEQIDNVESFKAHQSRMLTSLSLIVSVAALILGLQEETAIIPPAIFILVAVAFVGFVIIHALSIMPIKIKMPIKVDFDIFKEIYLDKPEKELLENKLTNYVDVVETNREIFNRMYLWSSISTVLYLVLIVLSLGMIFLSIW